MGGFRVVDVEMFEKEVSPDQWRKTLTFDQPPQDLSNQSRGT